MKQSGGIRLASILAICTLLLGLATQSASPVLAQSDEKSYEFASGQVLKWTGNWEIDEENSVIEGELELVVVTGEQSFLGVMSVPAGEDLDQIRDNFLSGFLGTGESSITIDRDSYGAVSYSLDTLSNEGTDLGAFTLLRSGENGSETFAWIFVSLIPTFSSEFDKAQSSFTLDGTAPFTGIESSGLQSQLETAIASGGEEDVPSTTESDDATPGSDTTEASDGETPVVDSTEEATSPDDDETPTSGGGLKGGSSDPATEASDPATEETDPVTEESEDTQNPTGEVGLISPNAYVSPAYGVEVEWGPTLVLDPEREANPVANTTGLERLWLETTSESRGFVNVTILSGEGVTVDNVVTLLSSDEQVAETAFSPDAEIVLSESSASVGGVVLVDFLDDGTPVIFYTEIYISESSDALILVEYSTIPQVFEDAFAIVKDELTVDGHSVLEFFTATEILEAAGQ